MLGDRSKPGVKSVSGHMLTILEEITNPKHTVAFDVRLSRKEPKTAVAGQKRPFPGLRYGEGECVGRRKALAFAPDDRCTRQLNRAQFFDP